MTLMVAVLVTGYGDGDADDVNGEKGDDVGGGGGSVDGVEVGVGLGA